MNKIVKRKLIGSIFCIIVGISCLIYSSFNYSTISEELSSYMNGFTVGIITVGILTLITVIRVMKNPNKSKELEIANNDERLKSINANAMAITFRISVIIEALISIICAVIGKMDISQGLGLIIAFQIIIFLITYYIINKNN